MEQNVVVAITAKTMGNGDEELGKILLKGFIHALTMQEVLPKTIVFYKKLLFSFWNNKIYLDNKI